MKGKGMESAGVNLRCWTVEWEGKGIKKELKTLSNNESEKKERKKT